MNRLIALLAALLLPCGPGFTQPLSIYTEISPPAQYLDPSGNLTGFSVDLVREIQRRTGNTDPIEMVPWVRSYHELQTKPNVVLFTIARNEDRDPQFEWIGPIRDVDHRLYVRADSAAVITSLEDAKKLHLIGVYKEDIREQYLVKLGFTNLDRSIDNTIIVKKLMAGRIDAFVSNTDAVDQIMRTAGFKPEDVRVALELLHVQGYIAFSKGTPAETIRKWAKSLEAIRRDGTFERLFRKYFPGQRFTLPAANP